MPSALYFTVDKQTRCKLQILKINNGNWTEWSAIWSEIIRVISKSNERATRVWFEIIGMISDQNCTTRSSITTLLDPVLKSHNLIAYSVNTRTTRFWSVQTFIEPSYQICQTMAFLSFICLQCDWLVKKIGPQCVLGVLCLILFLSVGMLFSNISIWELTCYKWKGRQVITIFQDRTENILQNLRCWKYDWMWSPVFDTLYTQVHLSSQLKLKLRRKANQNYNIYTN